MMISGTRIWMFTVWMHGSPFATARSGSGPASGSTRSGTTRTGGSRFRGTPVTGRPVTGGKSQ